MSKFRKLTSKVLAVLLAVATFASIPNIDVQAAGSGIARGIDVSKYNGNIDWNAVKASGIDFVFVRVGNTFSGFDPTFVQNITGAAAAGLRTGVYLYSYAKTPEEAQHEAELCLSWIDGYPVTYPVVFDIEDKCQKNLSSQQIIDLCNAFCSVIDAAGYYPMVYSYRNMFETKLQNVGYDRWVARYGGDLNYGNNVCFWQYSSTGSVPGIGGRVDMNYQYKNYDSLIIPEGFLAHGDQTRFYRNWRMQRGWVDYADTRFYLDGAGNLVRGWFQDESGVYYLTPGDGSIARGQANVDGKDFYFAPTGQKTMGWVSLENGTFYYDPAADGVMHRDWMSDAEGKFYFFDRTDGHMLTGCQAVDGAEYLFGADGVRFGGWAALENGTFFYDPATGIKVKGFYDDTAGRHYLAPDDGHLVSGPVQVDGQQYFFSPEGVMMSGMIAREDGLYYYDPASGAMVNGWINIEDKTYYADAAGHIVTGPQTINKQNYLFDAEGVMFKGLNIGTEKSYYYDPATGMMVHGWFDYNGQTYYADSKDGHILVGEVTIQKKTYYFTETGALLRNAEITLKGKKFIAGEDGVLTAAP